MTGFFLNCSSESRRRPSLLTWQMRRYVLIRPGFRIYLHPSSDTENFKKPSGILFCFPSTSPSRLLAVGAGAELPGAPAITESCVPLHLLSLFCWPWTVLLILLHFIQLCGKNNNNHHSNIQPQSNKYATNPPPPHPVLQKRSSETALLICTGSTYSILPHMMLKAK